jgi:hypothetical protein
MVQVRVLLSTAGLPVLQVVLRMLQVVRTSRVASSYRALLEMALQNITPAKSVFAEVARIGALAGVSKQMALEMFQVQVRLVTMWALVLALGILGSVSRCLASSGRGPAGMGW